MQDDYTERMRTYGRRTADELLKQLHSRPSEEQTPTVIDCGVTGTPEEQDQVPQIVDCGTF